MTPIPDDCIAHDSPAMKLARTVKPRKYGTGSCAVKAVWLCQLRDYRKQTRLSMKAVADAVGLSTSGYFAIEHGSDPMLTTARKLADFFGATVGELWPELVK